MTLRLCVFGFAGVSALSTLLSAHPFQAFIRSTWTPFVLAGALLFPLVAGTASRWMGALATLLVLILFAGAAWQLHTGAHLEGGRLWRVPGLLPHPNDTALIAVALPFASWIAWPFGLLTVLWSGSRNALLGLVVAAVMLVRGWKPRLLLVGIGVLALLGFVHAAATTSLTSRLGHWAVGLRMFSESPWVGKGPHTFVDYYLTYLPAALPFGTTPEVAFIPWMHDLYLEQLAERGVLGLFTFAIPLGLAWRAGDRVLRAGLAAFLVMGVLDLSLLKPWVVIAYWGLVGVALCSTSCVGFSSSSSRASDLRAVAAVTA